MKLKIYCIPGLGCNQEIFHPLWQQLPQYKSAVQYLEFVDPISTQESVAAYTKRLATTIPAPEADQITLIVGLSLGGMIATELSKLIPYQKLILISTIKHQDERPRLFRLCTRVPVQGLLPSWVTRRVFPKLTTWFGSRMATSNVLFGKMVSQMSPTHLVWGRNAAISWFNDQNPARCVHIHGTRDHIFNNKTMQVTHTIVGGTHGMIVDKSEEVALLVGQEIAAVVTAIQNTPA